jgi:DNA primase
MEIIDQIRHSSNIIEIASQYTQMQRRGRRHVGLCPFHTEKTPSFYVDEDKQLYHCFGCGAGGDIFTLIMEKESMDFPEAMRFLAEKYNLKIPESKSFSPQYQSLKENIYQVTEDALAFFRKNLHNTAEGKKALDYLHQRNTSPDTIKKLRLGYAPNSWDALSSFFRRRKISSDLLEQAGLVLRRQNKEGHYDRFRGRIIFPIFNDRTGKVVAFGGRSLFDEDPKYLNSPDTPIYSKGNLLYGLNFSRQAIREKDEVILVEGYTDFLALFQAGFTHAAASLGTSLTPRQIDLLRRRYTSRIIACYDGDLAGRKASYRAVSLGFEQGAQVRVVLLPEGEDPDSIIARHGRETFIQLIQKSATGLKFLIDFHTEGKRPATPEAKARVAREVMREIQKIPDTIVRSEYIKSISESLQIDERELRKSVADKIRTGPRPSSPIAFLHAEKRLLQIVFEDMDIANYVFQALEQSDYANIASSPLWPLIADSFRRRKIPSIHDLKSNMAPNLFNAFIEILNEQSEQNPSMDEARDLVNTLKEFSLHNERSRLNQEISRYQKTGEMDKITELQKQIQAITQKLCELQHSI